LLLVCQSFGGGLVKFRHWSDGVLAKFKRSSDDLRMRNSNLKNYLRFKKKNRNYFTKIKEAFSVKSKIFFINYYFRSHKILKNMKIFFYTKTKEA
jgi:hypothetical protein